MVVKKNSNFYALFKASKSRFVAAIKREEMRGGSKTISFICQPILATFVNVSLKCGQDWLKDEEVENCKVTIIIFFGVLALVCFDVEISCRK